jgi:general nucleoside transport system permease protein
MIRFETKTNVPFWHHIVLPVVAVFVSLILASVLLALTGASAWRAIGLMVDGAVGSVFALSETLTRATPLIFTGLAIAVAFRAKFWNIGVEGQLYAGALAAVAIGSGAVVLPSVVMIPLMMLAGALAGAAVLVGPALAKTKLGVDEVVTTLLLNFITILFVQMMLEGALKDPMGMGWPQSSPIIDEAVLPTLFAKLRTHAGLLIGLALSLMVHMLMSRTVWGYEIRATGENSNAAAFAGIPVTATILRVALISGGLAGLAGVSEVAGLKGYLTADLSPGFGYTGIVVAMLAGLSPLGVVPAAIFVAAVFVGADTMSRTLGISNYFADLVVALALICVIIGGLFLRYSVSWVRMKERI